MKKELLQTPTMIIDKKVMMDNLRLSQQAADKSSKQLWPMIKTHKSIGIAKIQKELGACGFLTGTLDECEALCKEGLDNLMYAYPVADRQACKRVIDIAAKCSFIIRLDSFAGAEMLNEMAKEVGTKIQYTVILDSGGHRFGHEPDKIVEFADSLKSMEALVFMGISTHPGHVYACTGPEELDEYIKGENKAIEEAAANLRNAGYQLDIISTGSTPTFEGEAEMAQVNIVHPGAYVFNDCMQKAFKGIDYDRCALSVYTTVISNPRPGVYICDAGSKCLGLDKGAHGNTSISGHGYIKDHPELEIFSLSEEVGKIKIREGMSGNIKVGDRFEIIPNHACSAANLTSYYFMAEGDEIIGTLRTDMRSNSTFKGLSRSQ
ncbi:MAG: alanine racemase [Eubacteriales bacterium]|nr:alanine racemase [Eubacteriales bacterium]MDD4390414.1 alanine racemase [Eubacteriales bacterium]